MMQLEHQNISYSLITSDKINQMSSVLYSKGYDILYLQNYYKESYNDSIMTFYRYTNNDDLRSDILFLLEMFGVDSAIIKYTGESKVKKIFKNGSEMDMDLVLYNTDSDLISYIHEGLSFSFKEATTYWNPTKKEDFKAGMIVEYMNNNKWYKKMVSNPNQEYDNMYKLLIKYNKVRVQRA